MLRHRIFAVAGLAALCVNCSREPTATTIGVILPLTGDLATYGQKLKNGIDVAAIESNRAEANARRQIRVVYEDDKGDPKTAVSAFQKIIAAHRPRLIIGGATSSTALAIVPIADRAQTVLLSPSATSPKLTGMSRFFFRIWPSDEYEGRIMARFVADNLHLRRIAVLHVNNDWGVGISRVFAETARNAGINVPAIEAFEVGATDFRTTLLKASASKPEGLYVIGYIRELVPLLRQKAELRLPERLLGSSGFFDPLLLTQVGSPVEGAVFAVPAFDPESADPLTTAFVSAFRARYSAIPDVWAAHGYDAMRLTTSVLRRADTAAAAIRAGFSNTSGFEGVTGTLSFDPRGEVQKRFRIMTIRNGAFSVIGGQ